MIAFAPLLQLFADHEVTIFLTFVNNYIDKHLLIITIY